MEDPESIPRTPDSTESLLNRFRSSTRTYPYIHSYSPLHLPSEPEIENDFYESFEFESQSPDGLTVDSEWVHSHKYPRSLFLDKLNHVLDTSSNHTFDDVGIQCCPRRLKPIFGEDIRSEIYPSHNRSHQVDFLASHPFAPKTDNTAYIDPQGLMWKNPDQRQLALKNRANSFESYASLRLSIDAARESIDFTLDPEYPAFRGRRSGRRSNLFTFKRFASQCTPKLLHFQLRNLIAAYDKNTVFYSNSSSPSFGISKFDTLTGTESPLIGPMTDDPFDFKISTISTNSSLLAAGSFTGSIINYSHQTSTYEQYTLTTDPNGIINYIFVPANESNHKEEIIVASNDRRLWYFNHARGQIVRKEVLDFAVNCIAENPSNSNEVLIVGDTPETIIVDRRDRRRPPAVEMHGHRDFSFACDWSSENVFATGNQDGTIRIYDKRKISSDPWFSKPLTVLCGGLQGAVRNIRFDPTGKYLAFAESIDNVYVVDTDNMKKWGMPESSYQAPKYSRRPRLSGDGFGSSSFRTGGFAKDPEQTVDYQSISMFGKVTGLVFTPSDNGYGQVLTIGVSDKSVGGILQYELKSCEKTLSLDGFW
ncbi:unnamed protein product [Kuraishia capsulata CBS 1993]|uniref:DUF2415 domain-containing protein n=1 Tax=Kuraishia capsulata CBS 1993 TaxID=1382522 RepID=W6MP38_9ASCO|nr:uncharacterized protein KUCA_T00002816001 [Kuraishia capsulata CBS 1993]CDK26842.1 unnamed protein product [Kuraishia capsulata CBS 1993]